MATKVRLEKKNRYGIAEARAHLGELVDRVYYTGEKIILEKSGKPVAALVTILGDRELPDGNQFLNEDGDVRDLTDEEYASLTHDELLVWVNEIVHEVRRLDASRGE